MVGIAVDITTTFNVIRGHYSIDYEKLKYSECHHAICLDLLTSPFKEIPVNLMSVQNTCTHQFSRLGGHNYLVLNYMAG